MSLSRIENSYSYQYYPAMRGGQNAVPTPNVLDIKQQKLSKVDDKISIKGQALSDTVEISTKPKKKKLSKKAKWAIALGSTAALTILALKFGPRIHAAHNVKKLIPIKNLPENIEFKEAVTRDEAIRYAKEVLGIKEVKGDFSLETLNLINEGLTNVSNAQKGKVVMPSVLSCKDLSGVKASVNTGLTRKDLGTLSIDKKIFGIDDFDDFAGRFLKTSTGENAFYKNASGEYKSAIVFNRVFMPKVDNRIAEILDKFYKDPNSLLPKEKLQLKLAFNGSETKISGYFDEPFLLLSRFKDEFEKRGITYNLKDFENKSKGEISEYLSCNVWPKVSSRSEYINFDVNFDYRFKTIYHEMGHLQDLNKNYGIPAEKLDLIKAWRTKLHPAITRYMTKTDNEIKELLGSEKSRKLFEKEATQAYEFFTDKTVQQTAAEVSEYATHSIGEFIAETYSRLLTGTPVSERVMNLYRKYNGPLLP